MSVLPRYTAAVSVALAILLTGCATMQSHDETSTRVQSASRTGDFKSALQQLDERNASADAKKELLYNMERGELLRLDRRYPESTQAFLQADGKVNEWEGLAKTDPARLLGTVGAALISERLKGYEGQDYEKVWLTTRLALNRVSASDFDNARVDIKRTHEREAVIAEFRSKETSTAEEEAKSKGAAVQAKELNGYPVETLNDPEVLALKNGYQNALSHYLAGFLYEALNESGLAAPGYRKAIELRPGLSVLEEELRGLDDRSGFTWKRRQRMTDVLFVVEAGVAPARKPKAFTLPLPTGRSVRTVSISYPVIEPSRDPVLSMMEVSGYTFKLENVVDVNVMARRALKDEMPGMVLRGVTRAIAKGVMQDQLEKQGGVFGAVLGAVASVATEQADDRMWRMLPGRVYVGRGYLPPGEHKMIVNGRDFGTVKVDGQYALVPLRLYENTVVAGDVGVFGKLMTASAAPATKPEMGTTTLAETRTQTHSVTTQKKTKVKSSSSASNTVNASGTGAVVK
jgi:hypothetical protein